VSGRHRTDNKVRIVAAVAVVLGLVVVTGGAWVGARLVAGPRCTGEIRLAVAAAPEIAPAVRATATDWAKTAEVNDTCVVVDVTAQESADVAAAVAYQYRTTLIGVGQPNGTVQIPQVWVPDSPVWSEQVTRWRTQPSQSWSHRRAARGATARAGSHELRSRHHAGAAGHWQDNHAAQHLG